MWIVVGLGNPGPPYARTRHNAGFMVVETLAHRWGIVWRADDPGVRVGVGRVSDVPVLLAEPQLFMNRSGDAIAHLDRDAAAPMAVVYDDLDLPLGSIRVRTRGGSGGHLGVASMIDHVGADFVRVRVGIDRPPAGVDPADYVLEPFPTDTPPWRQAIDRAGDAVECVVTEGAASAMSRFNARPHFILE